LSLTFENMDFIKSGKIELSLSDTKIFKDVIIPIVEVTREFALSKGIDLEYKGFQHVLESMFIDKEKMCNVFFNLLINAIRYSYKGTTVYVKGISTNNNKSKITIENTGISIPTDWENKIFELYARADNAKEYFGNGTGIGLFVVKKIIEAHGGKIYVSNNNNPTIFTIELLKYGGKII
jgi:signal transduction histidine kinase